MKRLFVFLTVLVLLLTTFLTAQAGGPVREPFEYDVTYDLVYCGDFGGGDFWIMNNEVGSGVDKFWFDGNDMVYRYKWYVKGVDHLFAALDPEDPGTYSDHMVPGHYSLNGDLRYDPAVPFPPWDYFETEAHVSGNQWNIQLPGYGNVFHITLNVIFKDGELKREASLEVVDFENMCQYFSQYAPVP